MSSGNIPLPFFDELGVEERLMMVQLLTQPPVQQMLARCVEMQHTRMMMLDPMLPPEEFRLQYMREQVALEFWRGLQEMTGRALKTLEEGNVS